MFSNQNPSKGMLIFGKPENLEISNVIKPTTATLSSMNTGEILAEFNIDTDCTNIDLRVVSISDCPYMLELGDESIDLELSGTSIREVDYVIPDTILDDIFYECSELTKVSAKTFIANRSTRQLNRIFGNCVSFDIMDNLECLDAFDKITALVETFSNTGLTALSANLFRTNMFELVNLTRTLTKCKKLTYIPNDLFKNTPKMYSMSSVFENCTKLEFVHQGIFEGMNSLMILNGMFRGTGIKRVNKNFLCSIPPRVAYSGLFDSCVELNEFE